jgi:hypothetical protein
MKPGWTKEPLPLKRLRDYKSSDPPKKLKNKIGLKSMKVQFKPLLRFKDCSLYLALRKNK